jgi:DNA repair protein RadC
MADEFQSFSIKSWSLDDQPREKLRDKGRSVLSNAELIAILIRSGSTSESAVDLSKRILAKVDNNLNALARLTIKQLMQFKGIGEAKAISIAAALELGRRRQHEEVMELNKIESSTSVYRLMQPLIGELPHEEFWILYLNNSNKVIKRNQLSKGGMTGTLVDVRLVLKEALETGATALIMAHNHPSGTLKPSRSDLLITEKLSKAGALLDIKVFGSSDHYRT